MVRFEKVTIKYGESLIIKDVSFQIREKEKVVIYGKSGSGKTTILTTILGAHIPSAGTVYFDGEAVNSKNILNVRRAVSFIGQEPVLGSEKIRDAILLPYSFKINRGRIPAEEHIFEFLEKLYLSRDILEKDASVVSGGEKQRVAIVRELLQDKKVFLVDELTSALDKESKKAVLDLFRDSSYTLISVSHDSDWYKICERFMKVDRGRIVNISHKPDPDFI
jgi:putative ABC transport system ATP-binding protein